MTTSRGQHAIVLGASMAGLLAARALADHYAHVTLLERDLFPETATARRGVPQGRHTHGLLSSGRAIIEDFFPGFTADIQARGALIADLARDARWHVGGGYFAQPPEPSGLTALMASRPLLEGEIRRRVLALSNVSAIESCDVLGLATTIDRSQVTGVRVRRGGSTAPDEIFTADLVVDATGRGSRLPAWLETLHYAAPHEDRVEVQIGYSTQLFRRAVPLPAGAVSLIGSSEPDAHLSGVYVPIEGDRWMVTLTGYLGDYPPTDEGAFRAAARSTATPEISAIVDHAEPIGPPVSYRFAASMRRRYERLQRFPAGLLVLGDALCSFNPVYGQGMAVAALEAGALSKCLERGTDQLAKRFFGAAARIIDAPWSVAVGADLRFPEVDAPRGLASRLLNWYMGRLQYAARFDWRVARTFLLVGNLVEEPSSLLGPATLWRVVRAQFHGANPAQPVPELDFGVS